MLLFSFGFGASSVHISLIQKGENISGTTSSSSHYCTFWHEHPPPKKTKICSNLLMAGAELSGKSLL